MVKVIMQDSIYDSMITLTLNSLGLIEQLLCWCGGQNKRFKHINCMRGGPVLGKIFRGDGIEETNLTSI
jgi:hypothetical protein